MTHSETNKSKKETVLVCVQLSCSISLPQFYPQDQDLFFLIGFLALIYRLSEHSGGARHKMTLCKVHCSNVM